MFLDQQPYQIQKGQNIAELASGYVKLTQSKKVLRGHCPFHADSQNSFMISPDKNIFKCFGCGKEGGPEEFLIEVSRQGMTS